MSQSEMTELKKKERLLREAAAALSVSEKDLPRVVERFLKEIEQMREKGNR